ncbi:uncharacterized protein PG998_004047 [Apiospora kogelbergensis]|uniref:Uncharacterized protein n=1 Tax=Apiospora kogelbergensis TaxID=1337665 RepID=A0AAW0QPG0_9PEZI
MQPSVIVCLLGSLVPALAAVRQDQPGPCDPDPCYRVIDSAACWSAVLLGTEKNASKIFDCVPGGKEEMCRCYGCDSILSLFVVEHHMCVL